MLEKLTVVLRGLISVLEKLFAWCLGLLFTGCVFALIILYMVPFAVRLPLDRDKYIARAHARIAENRQKTVSEPIEPVMDTSEERPPLSERLQKASDDLYKAVDKGTDDLINWINQKDKH